MKEKTLQDVFREMSEHKENFNAHTQHDDVNFAKIHERLDEIIVLISNVDNNTKDIVSIYNSFGVTSKILIKLFGFMVAVVAGLGAVKYTLINILKL